MRGDRALQGHTITPYPNDPDAKGRFAENLRPNPDAAVLNAVVVPVWARLRSIRVDRIGRFDGV